MNRALFSTLIYHQLHIFPEYHDIKFLFGIQFEQKHFRFTRRNAKSCQKYKWFVEILMWFLLTQSINWNFEFRAERWSTHCPKFVANNVNAAFADCDKNDCVRKQCVYLLPLFINE